MTELALRVGQASLCVLGRDQQALLTGKKAWASGTTGSQVSTTTAARPQRRKQPQ